MVTFHKHMFNIQVNNLKRKKIRPQKNIFDIYRKTNVLKFLKLNVLKLNIFANQFNINYHRKFFSPIWYICGII